MAASVREIAKRILLSELTDDTDVLCFAQQYKNAKVTHMTALKLCLKEESDPEAHVTKFVEEVVPRYTDFQFKGHFRMYRDAFEILCQWLAPHIPSESITVEKKILATLWLLGTPESYRSVSDRFGLNRGSLHHIVNRVCKALVERRDDAIKWPQSEAERRHIASNFSKTAGFPGVVGAIDGTYIPIKGQDGETRKSYICRKGFPAMNLQVVCTQKLLLLDVFTGNAGSVSDSRVFRNSPLHAVLTSPGGKLPEDMHLIGDSAYPLDQFLLVPFRDNGHLTCVERKFNMLHASTRSHVERAIGLLKGKFRRLKYFDVTNLLEVPNAIFACCVLHNFIIIHNGVHEEDIELEARGRAMECDEPGCVSAAQKRLNIANAL